MQRDDGELMIARYIIKHGLELAYDIKADAFMLFTETGKSYDILKSILKKEKDDHLGLAKIFDKITHKDVKIIIATPNQVTYKKILNECKDNNNIYPVFIKHREDNRCMIISSGIVHALKLKLLKENNKIVAVVGEPKTPGRLDTIMVVSVKEHVKAFSLYKLFESLDEKQMRTLKEVIKLAMEIGREGREGDYVGTIFVIGDTLNVMNMSRPLILNPFAGHNASIFDENVKGTIKELSSIDGAFIITDDGKVVSAGRHLETKGDVDIPKGLGSRHLAAASITKNTNAIAVTVSQSGGIVRVFKDGKIVFETDPRANILFLD
jgi:DNA integrity scanning protein DisA with diadenylate cyclase activity